MGSKVSKARPSCGAGPYYLTDLVFLPDSLSLSCWGACDQLHSLLGGRSDGSFGGREKGDPSRPVDRKRGRVDCGLSQCSFEVVRARRGVLPRSYAPARRETGRRVWMRHRIGATFIEVLTVIAILAILAAVALPVLNNVRRSGREASCMSQLRQIYQALELYGNDYPGYDPVHRNVDIPNAPMLRPDRLLVPYLGSRSLVYCPDTPDCARERIASTYTWVASPERKNTTYESQIRQHNEHFDDPNSSYPIVYCLVHDELSYFPSERHLAEDLNPPFAVRLLPDGSVKKGRFPLHRRHTIARTCR